MKTRPVINAINILSELRYPESYTLQRDIFVKLPNSHKMLNKQNDADILDMLTQIYKDRNELMLKELVMPVFNLYFYKNSHTIQLFERSQVQPNFFNINTNCYIKQAYLIAYAKGTAYTQAAYQSLHLYIKKVQNILKIYQILFKQPGNTQLRLRQRFPSINIAS